MTSMQALLGSLGEFRNVSRRAVTLVGAYLTTTAVVVTTVALLGSFTGAGEVQDILSFFLISSVAAGMEPGTAKAVLLRTRRPGDPPPAMFTSMYCTTLLKALLVSPGFAAVWWLADKDIGREPLLLLWTPVIVVLGFVATDVRVMLDARGRYAAAIWLKQGSLSFGLVLAAATVAFGLGIGWAVLAACMVRGLWTAPFAWKVRSARAETGFSRELRTHFSDKRWFDLAIASALGALGGSIDRLVAFRLLGAIEANAFFVIYEIFTKFWLLPYMLGPIIFALGSVGRDTRVEYLISIRLIIIAGIVFVIFAALSPELIEPILPANIFGSRQLVIFSIAIVLASITQIIAADLQGHGYTRATAGIAAGGLLAAAIAFPMLVNYLGVSGLIWAWLIKSVVEGLLMYAAKYRTSV